MNTETMIEEEENKVLYDLEGEVIDAIKNAYAKLKAKSSTLGELETGVERLLKNIGHENKPLQAVTEDGMKILLKHEREKLPLNKGN